MLSITCGCVCLHSSCWQQRYLSICDPWSDSSCYHLISLTTSPFTCWHHRCMAYMCCSPQLQLLILRPPNTRAHRREMPSPRKSLKWSFNEKIGQTVLMRCRAQPDKHTNQQSVYKPPVPFIIFSLSFPIFGSSSKHPIRSLVQLQNAFALHPMSLRQ